MSNQKPRSFTDAWNYGVEVGLDINQARVEQRYIVAKRVKTLRMEKGISQDKMSELIHANTLTYRGYENCRSDIPLFYLVRIANVLGTTLDYLAGRIEHQQDTALEKRLQELEKAVFSKD